MGPINPTKAGLALGALLGGLHVLWALVVALGWGQVLVDFIFWVHMMEPTFVVESFSLGIAALLIVITTAIGYAVGCIFAVLWNKIHR